MEKKTFLKLLTVIVAFTLLFAMTNVPVYAISSTDTTSITVDTLEAGVTATLYQIITVNYNYTADQPEDPEYTWSSSLTSWVSANYSSYIDTSDNSVTEDFTNASADDLDSFYSALSKAIKAGTVSVTASDTQTTSGTASYANSTTTNSSVTFSSVGMGQYVILVSGGYRVYSPVTASVVPTYLSSSTTWVIGDGDSQANSTTGITVSAKSEPVSITKSVGNAITSYSTADTATYTITADTIEYDANAVNTTYKITDVLGSGLTLGNVTVYGVGDSDVTLTSGTDYTLSSSTDSTSGETTLTITITDTDLLSTYSSIKVVYTATFNIGANLDYTNAATLTYSSDQYTSNASDVSISDSSSAVTVYFYGIDVTVADNSTKLSGAEFTLTDSDGNTIYFALVSGVYYVVDSTYTGATTTLTSDSNGLISIQGLSLGTYTLTQTKAADGYLVNSSTASVTLADSNSDGVLDSDSDNTYAITISNSSGFNLPTTGGIGTVMFTILGIVLIAGGVVLIVVKSRKQNTK